MPKRMKTAKLMTELAKKQIVIVFEWVTKTNFNIEILSSSEKQLNIARLFKRKRGHSTGII